MLFQANIQEVSIHPELRNVLSSFAISYGVISHLFTVASVSKSEFVTSGGSECPLETTEDPELRGRSPTGHPWTKKHHFQACCCAKLIIHEAAWTLGYNWDVNFNYPII